VIAEIRRPLLVGRDVTPRFVDHLTRGVHLVRQTVLIGPHLGEGTGETVGVPTEQLAAIGGIAICRRDGTADPGREDRRLIEGREIPSHPRHDEDQPGQPRNRRQPNALPDLGAPPDPNAVAEHQHHDEDSEEDDLFIAGEGRDRGGQTPKRRPLG